MDTNCEVIARGTELLGLLCSRRFLTFLAIGLASSFLVNGAANDLCSAADPEPREPKPTVGISFVEKDRNAKFLFCDKVRVRVEFRNDTDQDVELYSGEQAYLELSFGPLYRFGAKNKDGDVFWLYASPSDRRSPISSSAPDRWKRLPSGGFFESEFKVEMADQRDPPPTFTAPGGPRQLVPGKYQLILNCDPRLYVGSFAGKAGDELKAAEWAWQKRGQRHEMVLFGMKVDEYRKMLEKRPPIDEPEEIIVHPQDDTVIRHVIGKPVTGWLTSSELSFEVLPDPEETKNENK